MELQRFGVINQTTMLATEATQEVMDILKAATIERFGDADILNHFADTSDTLCCATNENQSATLALAEQDADIAFVVGGYNSSIPCIWLKYLNMRSQHIIYEMPLSLNQHQKYIILINGKKKFLSLKIGFQTIAP